MKTRKLLGTLLLFLLALHFASCNDDDKVDGAFDISQLSGQWVVTIPKLKVDAVERYVFYTKSQTCEACVSGPAVDGLLRTYNYVIDMENKRITLTDEKYGITEKYEILSLSAEKMRWKNLVPTNENTDKELVKEK